MSGDEDDEWRFSLEDVEDREADEDGGGNVAGSFLPDGELEPGNVDLENAAFVLLGVVVAGLAVVAFVLALT